MMDERKLGELFNAAVPDVPPPSFDHTDIASASRRQSARQRALLGGSALGVAILAGVTMLSVALWAGTGTREEGTAAGPRAPAAVEGTGNTLAAPNEVPNGDASGRASDKSFPPESSKQGDTPTGNADPSGPASTLSGCEKADLELAAALAGELQAAAISVDSAAALPADVGCPPEGRGAALRMSDGGVISVVLVPPGAAMPNPVAGQPEGTTPRAARTSVGGSLFLVSEPGLGSTEPPLADRLQDMAVRMAARY